jgi:stress response protein SCP2
LQETKDGRLALLSDYKVQPFATVHLLVLMYAIPQTCNHVTFDLSWRFPDRGCDALDASCFIFSGKTCLGVVDYCQTEFGGKSVWHSGDKMDEVSKTGHHTIDAKLKDIPPTVTHLFFTLSAWNSPTLAHYRDPCLKFFEASNKESDLCRTTFSNALDSPAVIMCYVERVKDQWKIFECHQLSTGNAKDYEPLKTNIRKLIKTEDVPEAEVKSKVVSNNEVDLAFAMDCTGSMGSYISQAQQVKGSEFSNKVS